MNLNLDPIQFLGLVIAVVLVLYNMFKGIFGGRNEKLDDFLKSLDVEEEEEADKVVMEKVKPLPKKKAPPHPTYIPKKPPKIVEYKVDATYEIRAESPPSRGELLIRKGNLRDLIVTQTILNKPPGAWW